ncbi:MAG: YjjG family noncanonical pyrimidine nucleotidase [Halanaerobiales bacterium]
MKNYKILLFDADGTLFDFDRAEGYALEKCIVYFEREFQQELHLKNYREINNKIWLDFERGIITAEELKIERFRQFINKIEEDIKAEVFAERYLDFLGEAAFLIEGVEELLSGLSKNYRMLILTNGLAKVQRKRLALSPIKDYFEDIVISEELGIAKPDPDIFQYSLDKMKCNKKDEVLMIGDSISSDIRGGVEYGIDTCWYNPYQQNAPEEYQPRYQIDDLMDLKKILL